MATVFFQKVARSFSGSNSNDFPSHATARARYCFAKRGVLGFEPPGSHGYGAGGVIIERRHVGLPLHGSFSVADRPGMLPQGRLGQGTTVKRKGVLRVEPGHFLKIVNC